LDPTTYTHIYLDIKKSYLFVILFK
jgi:hypothetical protein